MNLLSSCVCIYIYIYATLQLAYGYVGYVIHSRVAFLCLNLASQAEHNAEHLTAPHKPSRSTQARCLVEAGSDLACFASWWTYCNFSSLPGLLPVHLGRFGRQSQRGESKSPLSKPPPA